MERIGQEWRTDWPKLGGALLIATALVVAIRTARRAARPPGAAELSNVNTELDREIDYAVDVTSRVLNALIKRSPQLFAGRYETLYDGVHEEDVPQ